jgi:hypothetical protein
MDSTTVLPLVIYATTGVYVLSGVLSMCMRPNLYDQIGQGGLLGSEEERRAPPDRAARLAAERAEREHDTRQMLHARNERRMRQGHAPLDVDAELARLEGLLDARRPHTLDTELCEEIRQLAISRNERRLRQGLPALDVEREIARALAEVESCGAARASAPPVGVG